MTATDTQSPNTHVVDVVNEDDNSKVGRIARSTLILVIAFAVAKAISLVQTFIIADAFGVGSEYDAYVTANRIPEQIVRLLAGGALGYAFIPVFSGFLAKGKRDNAWRIASQVMSFIFIVSFGLSVLAFFTAPWLVGTVLAPGFTPEVQAQTVVMLRILLISTTIFVVSTVITDTLEGHHHFLSPALAPIMFDVGILIGVIFLLEPLGVYGIAWGAVIGAALHFLVQLPAQFYYRSKWRLTFSFNDPVFWMVLWLMLPRVIGIFVANVDKIIANNFASRLGEGAVSAYNWGWQLTQIPQTLLGTTLSIVMFPTLAALSEAGSGLQKQKSMTGAVKFLLITTIPSAVGLILVGRPLISILEGGAFDSSATDFVYSSLQYFALTIILFSMLELLVRGFYADKDTLTPLWIAIGGGVIHALVAITTSGLYIGQDSIFNIGVGGLALAASLGMVFEVSILLWLLSRRWGWNAASELGMTFTKTLIATTVMGVAVYVAGQLITPLGWVGGGRVLTLLHVLVMVGAGVIAFAAMAAILRIQEIWDLLRVVLRRKSATEALQEAAS